MKEYKKDFGGVTYTFTEGDLSEPFSYVFNKLKKDIEEDKERRGSFYTEEMDNKVQSLLDDYIVSSFECQVEIMNGIINWSKDITPNFAMHRAKSIGNFADNQVRSCNIRINCLAENLIKIGVPVCKQII